MLMLNSVAHSSNTLTYAGRLRPKARISPLPIASRMLKSLNISTAAKKYPLVEGYFTVLSQTYQDLLPQAQRDRWSVNWADHLNNLALEVATMQQVFDVAWLQTAGNQAQIYWNGEDWIYLYLWDATTQTFVEGTTTSDGYLQFSQGRGKQVYFETLAQVH